MSVLEGVTLLVQTGFSERFVLHEIPLDVFQDLIIVAQKHEAMRLQHTGLAMTVAIASVLSEKGATAAKDAAEDQIAKLDSAFIGDEDYSDYEDWGEPRKRPRPKKPDQRNVERMIRAFHNNFSRMTLTPMPSFDEAMRRAVNEQKRMAEVAPEDREG